MFKEKLNDTIEVGKLAYEAPCVERVQIETEGGFAGSQSVTDNSQSGVAVDTWTKGSTGTDTDTWSDQ